MGERLGAQFEQAMEDNPVPLFVRWDNLARAQKTGRYLPQAEALAAAERAGAVVDIPAAGVTAPALDIMIERALKRQARQQVIDAAPQGVLPTAAGIGVGIGAGFLDPIGLGLNFIPVVRETSRLGMAANSARLGTRLAARTGVGAIEGAVGQAIVEPFTGYVYRQEGQQYGLRDAVQNVAMGGLLGASAHHVFGGVGDTYRALSGKAQPWALPGTTPIMPEVAAAADGGGPSGGAETMGAIMGRSDRVKVQGRYEDVRWALVDADEVAVAMEKGEGQFRDRTRAASEQQIRGIANAIDFDELHWSPGMDKGAPTLTRDGTVVGGNGRAAAVRMAYDLPSGEAYAAPLRERLTEWGISPESARGMKKPMLVRIFEGDVDTRAAAVASNEGGTLRMSALEQAKVDGERLGKVGIVASDDGRLDVPENRGAIRRWVEQFPDAERSGLMDADGRLSPEGVTRLRNAALHEAFGDTPTLARLIDSTDSALGRVASALIRSAGKIAEVRSAAGRGELHGLDIGDDLLAAVEKFAWLREDGMPVDVYLQQTDLLGSGLSPEATEILAFLGRNSDSSVRMAEGLVGFYRGVEAAGSPSQGDLFGGGETVVPDRAALLTSSLAAVDGDRSTASAKMEAASPLTREMAMEVGVAQLMDGRDLEVQALVDMDPAIGQASLEDVRAAADRADSLESIRTVDMDASRSVAEAVASGPKKWGAAEALADGDAVVADLDLLAKNQDEAWKYARAYHGTPHIFPGDLRGDLGGFRWDKMGTGEGQQAYGYGHYMAQDERIARSNYRDRLVKQQNSEVIAYAKEWRKLKDPRDYFDEYDFDYANTYAAKGVFDILAEKGGTVGDAVLEYGERSSPEGFSSKEANEIASAIQAAVNNGYLEAVGFDVKTGSVYTIEIPDVVEKDFLQWDEDFENQPTKVREVFDAIRPMFFEAFVADSPRNFDGESAYGVLAKELMEYPEGFDKEILSSALEDLSRRRGDGGRTFTTRASIEKGNLARSNAEELVSIMLSQQGVHGQKFLDGNSRQMGPGNPKARFNYVVFDDETASLVARYMRGEGPGQAQDVVERIAAESFGDATRSLMDAGQISVVVSTKDLPGGPHPEDVRAMTAPDGKVYLVAQNLTAADIPGLILHEVGAHVGLSRMLGPDGFESVLADVDALLRSGSDEALSARAAVPSDTPSHLIREETLAYLLQNHPKHGIVRRVIAAVKAWLFENVEALRGVMRLTEEDMVSLAVSALRAVARDVDGGRAGGVMYSRASSTIDPKAELAPYDQAVTKAKGYADAVRAAAGRWGDDVAMRAAVEQASGGQVVGREVEELIDLLKVRHGEIVRGLRKVSMVAGAEDAATSLQDAALAAADQMAENEVRAAAVERRNAALSLAAKTRAISYVTTQFQGREIEGLKALIGGSQYLRPGARSSVSVERQNFNGRWMAGLEGDLRKDGVWQMFVEDAYQDDVARALWQMSLENGGSMDGIHPDAVKIAASVHRYQQDVKLTLNRHGAWIGNLQGWMFRQGHDMDKMRSAGFEKWSDFATTNLDWPRIIDHLGVEDAAKFDRMEFLKAAWDDLSNGSHFKPESLTEIKPQVGPGNLGKKASQSRTLHWKDADAGLSYLRQYGPGNGSLAETILLSFNGAARSAALMKVLGPNYEANLTAIMDHVGDGLRGTKQGDAWRGDSKTVLDLLHHVDGSLSIPHNVIGAKIGAGLRNWQSMAKLGAAVVSQVSDIPVYGAAIAHRFDTSIFHGIRDAVAGLLQGRAKGDRMDILRECGYYYDSVIQQTFARFDADDVPGAMSKAMQQFFKWGGITWWAETMRSSAVLTISRRMGDVHRTAHDALPKSIRDMLSLYRIDSGRWDLLRMAATREADGGTYLTPEGLRSVPDAALESLLVSEGRTVSPAALANLREDLASSYRSLLLDQSQYAALEPDERTRALLLRGTQSGTSVGEIARCFAQFKSFPVVYAQRVFGREIYGRGYDSVGAYVKSKDAKAFSAMLGLMVALTASGYISATAKDLLKLRKPRPIDDPRTWGAAFMQGGALGIYGDFLFGSANRLGGGLIPSLLGPIAGAASQGYGVVADARTAAAAAAAGEDVDPTDLAARGLDFALQNTPFLNLHLLRPALNAAFIWRMQEALNPGYLNRTKKRLKRDMGTEFLFDPAQVAR
ncbi:MAG: hypothetical protein IPL77_11275 [Flavobacteriales bacterium]|nr:hypothetical protein [Flavobacteriales bacterium]